MENSILVSRQLKNLTVMNVEQFFSECASNLVSIVNVDGKAKPLFPCSVKQMLTVIALHAEDIKVVLRKDAVDYGVLVLDIPSISHFISFTIIAQDGKIAYLTVYASLENTKPILSVSADTSA